MHTCWFCRILLFVCPRLGIAAKSQNTKGTWWASKLTGELYGSLQQFRFGYCPGDIAQGCFVRQIERYFDQANLERAIEQNHVTKPLVCPLQDHSHVKCVVPAQQMWTAPTSKRRSSSSTYVSPRVGAQQFR